MGQSCWQYCGRGSVGAPVQYICDVDANSLTFVNLRPVKDVAISCEVQVLQSAEPLHLGRPRGNSPNVLSSALVRADLRGRELWPHWLTSFRATV